MEAGGECYGWIMGVKEYFSDPVRGTGGDEIGIRFFLSIYMQAFSSRSQLPNLPLFVLEKGSLSGWHVIALLPSFSFSVHHTPSDATPTVSSNGPHTHTHSTDLLPITHSSPTQRSAAQHTSNHSPASSKPTPQPIRALDEIDPWTKAKSGQRQRRQRVCTSTPPGMNRAPRRHRSGSRGN